jgi:hypothetical protein
LPGDEDVERIVFERIIALLEARLRSRDGLKAERMQRRDGSSRRPNDSNRRRR